MTQTMGKPNRSRSSRARFFGIIIAVFESHGGDQHVFPDRILRQQMVVLKDKADPLIPKPGELWFW